MSTTGVSCRRRVHTRATLLAAGCWLTLADGIGSPRTLCLLSVTHRRGWANAGFHRDKPSPEVATPAIDAIVAEGIALDRMYAYPYCAPSRAALLSGRLPQHVSSGNIRGATYDANHTEIGGQGVPRNMTTLPQMLAQAGYWSAFAGKWDCGFATQGHIPHGRGYNSSLGYFFQVRNRALCVILHSLFFKRVFAKTGSGQT